jgi:hypothetical protein
MFVAWFTSKGFGGPGSTVVNSRPAQPDIEIDHHPDALANANKHQHRVLNAASHVPMTAVVPVRDGVTSYFKSLEPNSYLSSTSMPKGMAIMPKGMATLCPTVWQPYA